LPGTIPARRNRRHAAEPDSDRFSTTNLASLCMIVHQQFTEISLETEPRRLFTPDSEVDHVIPEIRP
jgi:hypothetical protein